MIARASWVGIALLAVLAAAPCPAQEAPPPTPEPSPAPAADTTAAPAPTRVGARPGRGSVGGLIGGSYFYSAEEYSKGALPRFDFSGQFRYVMSPSWRLQFSPGFTWAAYSKNEPPPFTDINNPGDTTKERYLTLLVPITAQLQLTWGRSPWHYHLGAGPGIYRLWIQNHRKVLEDPQTFRLHRGLYTGFTVEAGVERFLRALPNTSVEVSAANHSVLATRDDQFPAGWNSTVGAFALRAGVNYYFDLNRPKPARGLPGL
jgi:hypothetical protein